MFRDDLKSKANITFYQIFSIGLIFLIFVGFLSANLFPRLFLIKKSLLGQLESICGCTNYLAFTHHPFIFTSLMILGISIIIFFCFIIVRTIKIINSTHKFIKINLAHKKQHLTPKLNQLIHFLKLESRIIEIDDNKPIIFCFGLIKPRVCISSGLVKKLSRKELMAVLMHEQQHLTAYEPIRLFIVKIIAKALFFLPGLKLLTRQYLTFSELTADEKATGGFKNKVYLAKALYKVIKLEKQSTIKSNLALSFFSGITEERVNKLADNSYIPKFRFFTAKLSLGVLFIVFLPFVFNLLVSSNQINNHTTSFCPMTQSNSSHQCEILLEEANCVMSYDLTTSSCEN